MNSVEFYVEPESVKSDSSGKQIRKPDHSAKRGNSVQQIRELEFQCQW